MVLLSVALLWLLCPILTQALHESDVGVVDWYQQLVGVPLISSSATAPVFHRVGQQLTKSVILSATGSNVLAALDPVNGSVVWRHIYEPEDRISTFYAYKNFVTSVSGPGGATLRSFDALKGHLLLEKRLHEPSSGRLLDASFSGTGITFVKDETAESPDIFVLTNGHTLSRVGMDGSIRWSWSSSDHNPSTLYSKIVATSTTIYAIGLVDSPPKHTIRITALSTTTGEQLATTQVPSAASDGLHDFLVVRRSNESEASVTPRLVWLEHGSLTSVSLTPTLDVKSTNVKGSAYKRIIDVGLAECGQFLAVKDDGSVRVFKVNIEGSSLKSIWEFSPSDRSHVDPIFSGGLDKSGHPYITRIRWSHTLEQVAVELFAGHLGQGFVTGFTFPFNTHDHGIINHVALDCANPKEWTVITRLVVTTSTGSIQLWQHDKLQWNREESLSAISAAEFVELPEKVVSLSHLGEGRETFVQRFRRQLSDAQDFPRYAINFAKRFATGSYASMSSPVTSSDIGSLSRDTFGFRQVIVAATSFGKVFGIDSSNGEVLWSRIFGLGWAADVGGVIKPLKIFVTTTVSDGDSPQVAIVAQRRAENSLLDTVIFHLDALTGKDASQSSNPDDDVLQGVDVIAGPLVDAYILQDKQKIVVLLDEFLQVYLYPDTPKSRRIFSKAAPSLNIPLRTSVEGHRRLLGHQFTLNRELSDRYIAFPTWSLSVPPGEDIQRLIPSSRGPIASVGKVMGNRTTLYKYLNPRLFVTLTTSHAVSPPTCGIYVIDSAKGSVVYRVSVPAHSGTCDVKVALTENWLVYHYYDEDYKGVGQTKGYQMVTVELYEGTRADDKTRSSEISAFSEEILDLLALEQAYIFPHGITCIATTSTKFGITSKDIIVATHNHKIQSIPRRLLNPRRPNRKLTSEEQEELLVPYDPLLPDDARRTLSHNYEVANIRHILTSPALLESTSLVFAFGLDLFLTRVTPSNTFDVLSENFNKAQLVFTVSGLAVAIMITKPMVRRKRLRERWYQ